MATPKRPAKPGKRWTLEELDAYNICIKTVDTQAFFGFIDLPHPSVEPVILQNIDVFYDLALSLPDDHRLFFVHLHDTTDKDQPRSDVDFTYHLLNGIMQFDQPRGVTHTRTTFFFIMSGQRVSVVADLSLRRGDYQIILVQRDRVSLPLFPCCRASLNTYQVSRERAEPRLAASALGAFSKDNDKRTANGLASIASKRYIGIITIGTAHFFYKIIITQALVDAVMNSQFPAQETIVERFIPVPNVDDFLRDGMVPLDNRHACLQCYEGLKTLL